MYSSPTESNSMTSTRQSQSKIVLFIPVYEFNTKLLLKKDIILTAADSQFPSLPFSSEKTIETTTTTTTSTPAFSFGSLATKPALFGGFSSTIETRKDDDNCKIVI